MPLFRLDPEMERWRDDMLRMWNRMTQDVGGLFAAQPAHYVRDVGDAVVVEVELPGLDPAGVELEADPEGITVRGAWPERPDDDTARRRGAFSLSVNLPVNVDPDRATADFRHGLLTVTLPKAVGPRRKLPIRHDATAPPLGNGTPPPTARHVSP
jgi:HSP20 family protein